MLPKGLAKPMHGARPPHASGGSSAPRFTTAGPRAARLQPAPEAMDWTNAGRGAAVLLLPGSAADPALVVMQHAATSLPDTTLNGMLEPTLGRHLCVFELDAAVLEAAQRQALTQSPAGLLAGALAGGLRALPVPVRQLLAGAAAGATSKTVTAPLEVVKMQLAVQSGLSTWGAAVAVLERHGPLGFFRGNGVDVLRTSISKAAELAVFERLKSQMRGWNERRELQGRQHLPAAAVATIAGGAAGVLSTVLVYPLETARTRMAVATGCPSTTCTGLRDCLRRVVRTEGVLALFSGLDASLIGVIPYAAIRLGVYDGLKTTYKKTTQREHMDPKVALLFGALAGVVSSTATYPLEVVRRRMMLGAAAGGHPHFLAALTGIVEAEGMGALFNGVWLGLAKQAPQYAVAFASFEVAKQFLRV